MGDPHLDHGADRPFFWIDAKGWPVANDVRWLPDAGAIRFDSSGIAYVDDLRAVRLSRKAGPLTIEMAVTPANNIKAVSGRSW